MPDHLHFNRVLHDWYLAKTLDEGLLIINRKKDVSQKLIDGMYRAGLEIVDSLEEALEILVEHIQYLEDQSER